VIPTLAKQDYFSVVIVTDLFADSKSQCESLHIPNIIGTIATPKQIVFVGEAPAKSCNPFPSYLPRLVVCLAHPPYGHFPGILVQSVLSPNTLRREN
jgi:hypothetical protein